MFRIKETGAARISRILRKFNVPIFGRKILNRIEAFFLKRTKDRFAPLGSSRVAQKAPEGYTWKRPSPYTLRSRKFNRGNAAQALVDSGALRDSITIVNQQKSAYALQSPTGGGFSIGVRARGKVAEYARVHQFGGYTPNGKRIVARRYLGVSKKEDVPAVSRMTRDEANKFFRP